MYICVQVLPSLYVGSYRDSRDQEQMDRYRISHIVAVHDNAKKLLKVCYMGMFDISTWPTLHRWLLIIP
jgi:hypothetical protein